MYDSSLVFQLTMLSAKDDDAELFSGGGGGGGRVIFTRDTFWQNVRSRNITHLPGLKYIHHI